MILAWVLGDTCTYLLGGKNTQYIYFGLSGHHQECILSVFIVSILWYLPRGTSRCAWASGRSATIFLPNDRPSDEAIPINTGVWRVSTPEDDPPSEAVTNKKEWGRGSTIRQRRPTRVPQTARARSEESATRGGSTFHWGTPRLQRVRPLRLPVAMHSKTH